MCKQILGSGLGPCHSTIRGDKDAPISRPHQLRAICGRGDPEPVIVAGRGGLRPGHSSIDGSINTAGGVWPVAIPISTTTRDSGQLQTICRGSDGIPNKVGGVAQGPVQPSIHGCVNAVVGRRGQLRSIRR